MTMPMQEAIAKLPKPIDGIWRAFGDCGEKVSEPVATILNAAASGDMIPKADAEQAVALAYQRAADVAETDRLALLHQASIAEFDAVADFDRERADTAHQIRMLILSLAPADALAEVERMREEHDRVVAINVKHCESVNTLLVDGARLEDRAKAAEAEVEKLREALMDIADSKRLTSWGDPGTLRNRARAALGDAG